MMVFIIFIFLYGGATLESCSEFASGSTSLCLSCSEGYYSLGQSVFKPEPFPVETCLRKIDETLELEIYVSDKECSSPSDCNGSLAYPFDNLVYALDVIDNRTKMYSKAVVKLYLLGDEIYITQKNLQKGIKYYFRKTLNFLTISPFFCSIMRVIGCKEESWTIKINIKSNLFIIFISGVLHLRNIHVLGIDMPLEKEYASSSSCYQENTICCSKDNALYENYIDDCQGNFTDQTAIYVNKANTFGLFNLENYEGEKGTGVSPPEMVMDNCKFERISTFYPTDTPRFSSLVQFIDIKGNLTLMNVIVNECSFADGLLKQVVLEKLNIGVVDYTKSTIKMLNVSLFNIKAILYEKRNRSSIIFIPDFGGEITVNKISLTETRDFPLLFLDIGVIKSKFEIVDVIFIKNEDVSFLRCAACKNLIIEGATFINSNMYLSENILLFDIRDSEEVYVSKIWLQNCSFYIRNKLELLPALALSQIQRKLVFSEFYLDGIYNLALNVESSFLILQQLVVLEMSNDIIFFTVTNSSLLIDQGQFMLINLNYGFLISIKSNAGGSDFILRLQNVRFTNILFFKDDFDSGIIEWPVFTPSDALLAKNVSIFKCLHNIEFFAVSFFVAYKFSRVELENIEFSNHTRGVNTLIFLWDFLEVKISNVKFKNNKRVDYYLIFLYSSESKIDLRNIEIEQASFTFTCFYLRNFLGYLENITFTEINGIYRSPKDGFYYNFKTGLIFFADFQFCTLENLFFKPSEISYLTRSCILYIWYVINITCSNLNLFISETTLKINPPEAHALLIYRTNYFTLQGLTIRNFYCQQSFFGDLAYLFGVLTILISRSPIKEPLSKGQIYLSNLSIENCKFCKSGTIGIMNINIARLRNISIANSENTNGGAVTVLYGNSISIENIIIQNTFASQNGGAIYLKGSNSLVISNIFIQNTRAQLGGAAFIKDINNLTFKNFTSRYCKAIFDGGIVYAVNTMFTLEGGSASYYEATRDGGFAFIKSGSLGISAFEAQFGLTSKGGYLFAFEVYEISLKNISVRNVLVNEKGVLFLLEDCSILNVKNINFLDSYSDSAFGNMLFIARYKPARIEITNVFCLGIHLSSSTLVHLENELDFKKNFTMTMTNIMISHSIGSVAYFKSKGLYKEHIFRLENVSITEFIFYSSSLNEIDNTFEQALTFESSNLIINNLSFTAFTFKAYCLGISNSQVMIDNFFFETQNGSKSEAKRPSIFYSIESNLTLLRATLLGGEKSNTMLVSSEDSTINLENCLLYKCHVNLSSCIYVNRSSARLHAISFFENEGYPAGAIIAQNSFIIVENCDFRSNSVPNKDKQISINDIFIVGKKLNFTSIIRFCTFFESKAGNSIHINTSSINISNCSFLASSTKDLNMPFKALWIISSDVEIIWSNFSNFISKNGGTIKAEHETNVQEPNNISLKFLTISNSTSDMGGAFSFIGLLNVFIYESRFSNNKALKNDDGEYGNFGVGLVLCDACKNGAFYLQNNIFQNNIALNYMATVFSNVKIEINSFHLSNKTNEPFDSNQYFNNTDGTNFQGNLSFLPFTFKAFLIESSGVDLNESAFLTTSGNLSLASDQILGNSDNNILNQSINQSMNQPHEASLGIESSSIISIRSGQSLAMRFILLDALGQKFIYDHFSRGEITYFSRTNFSFFQISKARSYSDHAEFNFNDILIKADLNRSLELLLQLGLNINYVYQESKKYIKLDPLQLHFFTRPCKVGDIIIQADSSCVKCPPGKFSLEDPMKYYNTSFNDKLKCRECPQNAVCLGGSSIIPKKGFWRYSNDSSLIIECLSKFSCLGIDDGQLTEKELIHGKCLKQNTGPLCYICEQGYAHFTKTGVCELCSTEIDSYIKLALLLFIFLIYSLVQLKLISKSGESSSIGILLKIILTHFQQLNLITLVDLGWTTDFQAFFSIQRIFAFFSEDLLPLECLLQIFQYNIFAQKVLLTNAFPIALFLIVFISWVTFLKISRVSKINVYQTIHVTFFIVILLLFPEVISKCLSLLNCLKVEDNGSKTLLLYSPDVLCWSEQHISYIKIAAIPGLIAWGIFSPILIGINLLKYKVEIRMLIDHEKTGKPRGVRFFHESTPKFDSQNNKLEKASSLKFLCKGYSSEFYYWELIIFLKKFLFIAIGCITSLIPSKLRGVFLLVPLSFFITIQIRCKPFESPNMNKLELFSLMTIFLTADAGVLMFSKDFQKYPLPTLLFVIILNCLFFLCWLYLFLKEIFTTYKRKKKTKFHIKNKETKNIMLEIKN